VTAAARPVVAIDGLGTLVLLERAPLDPARRRRLDRVRAGLDLRRPPPGEPVAPLLAEAEAYVTEAGPVDAAMLARAPRLRLVQLCGELAGPLDLAACAARGVAVSRLALPTTRAVAEHVLMLALAGLHGLGPANAALHGWAAPPPASHPPAPYEGGVYNWLGLGGLRVLRGRRLGVLGLGDVGTEVARLARRLGMRVSYHRRRRLPAAAERRLGVRYRPLDDLLRTSDVLSVHLRRSPETRGLVDRAALGRLPPGAVLVDTSRGGIVDSHAVADALREGRLAAAGLDVFPEEPLPPGHPLAGCPGALLTPHCAGGSLDLFLDEAALVLGNVRRALAGRPARGAVRA
jgi:phosphoglycerate dehydrogenase-like enzyme